MKLSLNMKRGIIVNIRLLVFTYIRFGTFWYVMYVSITLVRFVCFCTFCTFWYVWSVLIRRDAASRGIIGNIIRLLVFTYIRYMVLWYGGVLSVSGTTGTCTWTFMYPNNNLRHPCPGPRTGGDEAGAGKPHTIGANKIYETGRS
jgi:hypothetical protein